jgi:hypothetical protein
MIKTLAAMTAATVASMSFGHAATLINPSEPVIVTPGLEFQEYVGSGLIGPDATPTSVQYDFIPVDEALFDISVSATDTESELQVIIVSKDDEDPLVANLTPGQVVSGAVWNFDSFTTSENFSIFINGDDLDDLTSYSINIRARVPGDNVAPIPVPAAGLMMMTALGGFGLARRKRKADAQ